jgi:hypothetical protein
MAKAKPVRGISAAASDVNATFKTRLTPVKFVDQWLGGQSTEQDER